MKPRAFRTVVVTALALGLVAIVRGVAATAVAPSPDTRVAPPDAKALVPLNKSIEELFHKDLTTATKPEQRTAVADRMLAAAATPGTDSGSLYALLLKARDLYAAAGAVRPCLQVCQKLIREFQVDPTAKRLETYPTLAKVVKTPEDRDALLAALSHGIVDALDSDHFSEAARFAGLVEQVAHGAPPTSALVKAALAEAHVVPRITSAHSAAAAAQTTLNTAPDDPAANLAVAQYLCFYKHDWPTGIPFMSRCGDAAFKAMALREVATPVSAADRTSLGDGWWELGDKLTGESAAAAHARAGGWYRAVVDGLTGLTRIKVEKRLGGLDEYDDLDGHRVVNLLSRVDLKQDVIAGPWSIDNGHLKGENGRMAFAYEPPDEFDYRVEFQRVGGPVVLIISSHGTSFILALGDNENRGADFGLIKLPEGVPNPTIVHRDVVISPNVKHVATAQTRAHEIAGFLDDEKLMSYATDYSDLSLEPGWQLNGRSVVGLGNWEGPTQFLRAEVVEIKGHGIRLR